MKRVNQNELPWIERTSPRRIFRRFRRDLSGAFAGAAAGPALPGSAPFDVELVRLPPGATNFPFHAHAAEWECYLILARRGTVRHGDRRSPLRAGDCLLCPPGEPHQLRNDGAEDLLYYVIANNAPADVWHYPDSDKWGFARPAGDDLYFRAVAVDYFDGEE